MNDRQCEPCPDPRDNSHLKAVAPSCWCWLWCCVVVWTARLCANNKLPPHCAQPPPWSPLTCGAGHCVAVSQPHCHLNNFHYIGQEKTCACIYSTVGMGAGHKSGGLDPTFKQSPGHTEGGKQLKIESIGTSLVWEVYSQDNVWFHLLADLSR